MVLLLDDLIVAKIAALGYPHQLLFNINNKETIARLVLWLENRKIREYPQDGRSALAYSPEWSTHLQDYLRVLDCPLELDSSEKSLRRCLHWLLSHAISLDYYDRADEIRAASDHLGTQQPELPQGVMPTEAILDTERTKLIDSILRDLGVSQESTHGQDEAAKLRLVHQTVLRLRDSASFSDAAKVETGSFPLGFDTGDPLVDEAATVMRLLYVEDLRDLQASINSMLSHIQTFTANPKTNTRLGRVGR